MRASIGLDVPSLDETRGGKQAYLTLKKVSFRYELQDKGLVGCVQLHGSRQKSVVWWAGVGDFYLG